jgi:peptidylprolyl isomerase
MPPMQRFFLIIAACLALALAGCGSDSDTETAAGTDTSTKTEENAAAAEKKAEEEAPELPQPQVPAGKPPTKLVVKDVKKGSGATAKAGDEASVYYVGVVFKTKEQFDADWDTGEPFTFKLGAGDVIKGWDQGVQGMKVGGERELILPPNLAYGSEGVYPSIPPNSTLIFLVKLLKLK